MASRLRRSRGSSAGPIQSAWTWKHSLAEERLRAIGKTRSSRSVFLVFTLRERDGRTYIRPISARYMHRREVESYEKKIPIFRTDEEAERFVAEADLTEYDLSQFKPVRFEFEKKAARLTCACRRLC
jgi:hypothetical protein